MRYNIPQIQSRLNEFAVLQAGKLKPAQKFNPPLLPLCHPHAHSVTLSHTQMHTHAHTHTLERQAPGGICFFFFFLQPESEVAEVKSLSHTNTDVTFDLPPGRPLTLRR